MCCPPGYNLILRIFAIRLDFQMMKIRNEVRTSFRLSTSENIFPTIFYSRRQFMLHARQIILFRTL